MILSKLAQHLPIWTMFAISKDMADKIQVLVLFVVWRMHCRSHYSCVVVTVGARKKDACVWVDESLNNTLLII